MLRFGDDLAGPEVFQPGDLPAGEFDLPLRQAQQFHILGGLFIDFLDRQLRLPDLPLEPLDVKLVVPRIDLEQHCASLDELPFVAGRRLQPHPARDLRGKRHLAERHHDAVGLDREALGKALRRHRPHRQRRSDGNLFPLRGRLTAHRQENGDAHAQNHQRRHPTQDRAKQAYHRESFTEWTGFDVASGGPSPRAARA